MYFLCVRAAVPPRSNIKAPSDLISEVKEESQLLIFMLHCNCDCSSSASSSYISIRLHSFTAVTTWETTAAFRLLGLFLNLTTFSWDTSVGLLVGLLLVLVFTTDFLVSIDNFKSSSTQRNVQYNHIKPRWWQCRSFSVVVNISEGFQSILTTIRWTSMRFMQTYMWPPDKVACTTDDHPVSLSCTLVYC